MTPRGNSMPSAYIFFSRMAIRVSRLTHICAEAPLEAGEEALLHALHFHRLVAGQDNLLARLVEVVEDVEEHVLRLPATEELHVVHDEDVHELVEVGEVVDTVVHRVDELVRELFRVDVEDRLLRKRFLISIPIAWARWVFPRPTGL